MAYSESFPILYFNMAGEMIYIIDQRLTAQSVEQEKAHKVLNDITQAMFNGKLVSEVFKPHNSITFALLRSIFEKLAHSSIMRLNEQSMNKLFDLMVMVVKYQLTACAKSGDLILLTDNHLSSLQQLMATSHEETAELVSTVRNQFLYHYQNRYDLFQLQLMRYSLLNLLKDIHTRVSIFLREGIQNADGRFFIATNRVVVECECQIPGVIRYFNEKGIEKTENFETGAEYVVNDQRTTLGLNIYRKELSERPAETGETGTEEQGTLADNRSTSSSEPPNAAARNQQNEMNLLALLICKAPGTDANHVVDLKFEFLETDEDLPNSPQLDLAPQQAITEKTPDGDESTADVTGFQPNQQHLIDIIKDLSSLDMIGQSTNGTVDSTNGEDDGIDYLELMDS